MSERGTDEEREDPDMTRLDGGEVEVADEDQPAPGGSQILTGGVGDE